MQSNWGKPEPADLLAHNVVNKLSAIIGFCDLLIEKAEKQDAECARRLTIIHELAKSAAKELTDHQCHFSPIVQSSEEKNLPV
jgi:light-regulated signal transduction histidine kinase (bacteriophytochrome)